MEADRDIFDDVGAFESALIEKPVEIALPEVRALLLAVDRSNQDQTAIALAGEIARRCGAAIHVVYAPEDAARPERETYPAAIAAELQGAPWGLAARPAAAGAEAGPPARRLIAAAEAARADLMVLPAPYLRDVSDLGDESLSATVDLLMAEKKTPLLLARWPIERPADCFSNALVAVSVYADEIGTAAGWALRLVDPSGTVKLLAVPDDAVLAEARRLLGDKVDAGALTVEALIRAERKEVGALIAAIQRRGAELGIDVRIEVKAGRAVEIEAAEANARPCIVCTGAHPDRTSPAFHRAHDLILRSRHPVLVT